MTSEAPARQTDISCEEAFRSIAEACAAAIDAGLAVFLSGDDPSGPHKARVALRRLTTGLDAFAPILRHRPAGRLRKEAKAIFRDLGAVRDSDVYTASRADEAGAEKRQQRNLRLREKIRARLRKQKAVAFAPRILAAVQPGGDVFRQTEKAVALRQGPLRPFAAQILGRAWQHCLDYGSSVDSIPQRDRHDFRKDMKGLRYLAEFFDDLFPGLGEDPFRSDFRDIQDALGILNDYAVALALEGRRMPDKLPKREAEALAAADRLWRRLTESPVPWA